jgi:hypothetical protein
MTPGKEQARALGGTVGVEGQASEERIAEITSGRIGSQQRARSNLQGPLEISVDHEVRRRELVWRMSSYERGRRGNAFRGGVRRHPDASNAGVRQRSSGHLAVPEWSTTEVGRAMIFFRDELRGKPTRIGVYASERLNFTVSERPHGESQGQNRNRANRPSGIVGGPRGTRS